ncbi:MAG: sulfatase-like hydrolase/transferase, partial [Actinomycetota bacterium]|nr:sulfatase-like hydrolase/transferase [Actinomycetota bacterium]
MEAADAHEGPPARRARVREFVLRGVQLLVLSAFAVTQPLLDVLGKNAEFFAVRGSSASEIVLFALAVAFVPALVLLACEALAGALDARLAAVLHLVFVAGLTALFAVQALERVGVGSTAILVVASVVAGAAAAAAVSSVRLFRTFLTLLAPAPVVFLVVFLFGSPVRTLVLPEDADVALAGVSADTPVVVVVFDELPVTSLMNSSREIDSVRYPSFARLARQSTWFRNATTLSSSTTLAVPALLTGNEPERGRLPVFQEHPRNLFTLLGRRYSMNVVESQTRLCPRGVCGDDSGGTPDELSSLFSDARVVYLHLVAPPELEDRLPPIDEGWMNFGEENPEELHGAVARPQVDVRTFHVGRVRDFRRFVASLDGRSATRPSLNFLHTLLPHGPWVYFPSGRVSAGSQTRAPARRGELWLDDWLALQAYQRHLLQLGFTDRLLGQLLRRLERVRLFDRALVVVTSDHGVSFRGGDKRRAPTRTNVHDLAFVPLFVKLPNQRKGRVVERHVRIVDILPTLADALDVELPWRVDGRSAFSRSPRPATVRVGRIRGDLEAMLARRDEALRRLVALFGSGSWDVFGVGPYRPLVGRAVASFTLGGEADARVTLDETAATLLGSLRRHSAVVPSPLTASLSGEDVSSGTVLAVAVNG